MRKIICFILMALLLMASCLADEVPELKASNLTCKAAVLIDADTGEVLFAKNETTKMYPASTTKIMTLLLGLESEIGLDTVITIPQEAYSVGKDSSLVPVNPGEQMTFRDLLYGFMLTSGNDGAISVAVLVSGSEKAFCEKMNERAAQLGCTGTHFANSHGYHDDNHFTTAYDMALITKAAMQNETFRDIVKRNEYTMTVSTRGEVTVYNTNLLLQSSSDYYYADAIGVKTGFTTPAGNCLVGAAEQNGITLISVAFFSGDKYQRFTDSRKMLKYGFTRYTPYSFSQLYSLASGSLASVTIDNAIDTDPGAGVLGLELVGNGECDLTATVELINDHVDGNLESAVNDFSHAVTISLTRELKAPVYQGEVIATISYTAKDGTAYTGLLVASRDIEAQPEKMTLLTVFPFLSVFENPYVILAVALVVLLVILIVMLIARKRRIEKARRRALYEKKRRAEIRRRRAAAQKKREQQKEDEE